MIPLAESCSYARRIPVFAASSISRAAMLRSPNRSANARRANSVKRPELRRPPSGLVGVYEQGDGIYFVFHGRADSTDTTPGSDILSCEWLTVEELAAVSDSELLRPSRLRSVLGDVVAGIRWPVDVVRSLSAAE